MLLIGLGIGTELGIAAESVVLATISPWPAYASVVYRPQVYCALAFGNPMHLPIIDRSRDHWLIRAIQKAYGVARNSQITVDNGHAVGIFHLRARSIAPEKGGREQSESPIKVGRRHAAPDPISRRGRGFAAGRFQR
jgi:hypothetical protein